MNSKEIEILEGFINNEFQTDKLEMDEKGGLKMGTIYKVTELSPSIETLLKRHKELMEENSILQRELSKYKQLQINIQGMRNGKSLLQNYMNSSILKEEIEEPINVLINFAVCCSPSLNCDEYCTYNDEDCTCGKLNEDFELRKSVLKLREFFPMEKNNE